MGKRWMRRRMAVAGLAVLAAVNGLAPGVGAIAAPGTPAADAPLGAPETVLPAGIGGNSVAVDSLGNAYIGAHTAAAWNPEFVRIAPDGTRTSMASTGTNYYGSVAVGPDDSVYAGAAGGIERIAPNGSRSLIVLPGLDEADTIAIAPDGTIWFSDGTRVRRRAPGGATTTIALSNVGYIIDIALGPDGSLYVLDLDHKKVVRRTPSGVQTSLVSLGTMHQPFGISVDGVGTLRVADGGTVAARVDSGAVSRTSAAPFTSVADITTGTDGTLYVLDSDTARLLTRPPSGPDRVDGDVGVHWGTDVAVGADGTVWVGDELGLLEVAPDGSIERTPTPDRWQFIAMGVLPDGSVVVGLGDDEATGRSALWTVRRSGADSFQERPKGYGLRDLAVGPDGTVYVAEDASPGGRVVALAADGTVARTVAEGYWPSAVAVDGAGTVYYADDGLEGGRVVAVSPLGAKRSLPIRGGWHGLAVDGAGNVYASDPGVSQALTGTPWVLPRGGTSTPATSWHADPIDAVYGMATGPDGSLYMFVNDALVRFRSSAVEVPAAPMVASVVGGASQVTVAWTRPPDHRSAITGYEVIPSQDGVAQPALALGADQTSAVIDGLSATSTYTFTVRATNAVGTGPASWASNAVTPGTVRYAPFTRWDRFASRQLADFTGSPGTTASRSLAVATLIAGRSTPASYVNGLRQGSWFHPHVAPVIRLYVAYFARTPDAGGLRYWADQHRRGRSLNQISATFAASSEFARTYGKLTDAAFVDLVYTNVLGRSPDAGGRSYWINRLSQGTSRGSVMTSFSESSEFVRRTDARVAVIEVYLGMLGRRPTDAELVADAGRPITSVIDAIRRSPAYAATV